VSAARLACAGPDAALVAGFLLLAFAYGVVIPVFEAPDEPQHFFVAQHLAHERRLPVQSLDPERRGPWEQEGSQPPLYYALAAPLVALGGSELRADDLWVNHQNTMGHPALVGNENRYVHDPAREGWPWRGYALGVHLGRLLSTALGAVTVLMVRRVALRVVGRRRNGASLAWGAAAVVAFNPQFLAVAATFSNDMLVVALSTTALALLLRVADGHRDRATVLALAAAVGLAPLAKLSGLALAAFAPLTLAALAWRRRDARLLATTALPLLAALALLAGWWYVRNALLYGEPTGLSHMLPDELRRDFNPSRWLRGLPAELTGTWYSAWGLFGWFTVMMPAGAYHALSLVAGAALGGLGLAAARRATWVNWPRLAWLAAWAAMVLASLLRWTMFAKGAHGRLLFPAVAVLGVALIAGWRAIVPRRLSDRALALTAAGLTAALAVHALWFVVRPAYALAPVVSPDRIPAAARPAGVLFDGRLRLVAVEVPERVVSGERFPLTMYWRAEEAIHRDGLVALRLDQPVAPGADADPAVARWETVFGQSFLAYPGAGTTPPALLQPGRLHRDRRLVQAPEPIALVAAAGSLPARGSDNADIAAPAWRQPVLARLSVHVYDPGAGRGWPAAADGEALPAGDWSTDILLEPAADRAPPPPDDARLVARFANGVDLYVPAPGWHPAAGTAALPVVWLPRRQLTEELTAFVHLHGPDGGRLGVFDRPPATAARYPTTAWRAGEAVWAWLPVTVPPAGTVPARSASLRVGLYRADGSRVEAQRPHGDRWPDDAVVVTPEDGP